MSEQLYPELRGALLLRGKDGGDPTLRERKQEALRLLWRSMSHEIKREIVTQGSAVWTVMAGAIIELGEPKPLRSTSHVDRISPQMIWRDFGVQAVLYVGGDTEYYFCSGAYREHCQALGIKPESVRSVLEACECSPWDWECDSQWMEPVACSTDWRKKPCSTT